MERWLPVVGYEGSYEVSDLGRVRSLDRRIHRAMGRGPEPTKLISQSVRGQLLRPVKITAGGYLRVSLSDGADRVIARKIHQLVAAAFIGPCPPGQMPLHGDGNPEHNRLTNLRYGTGVDNSADARAHGTLVLGEARSQAKLRETDVAIIKGSLGNVSQTALGRVFGVSRAAISLIKRGENWRHVAGLPPERAQTELDLRESLAVDRRAREVEGSPA